MADIRVAPAWLKWLEAQCRRGSRSRSELQGPLSPTDRFVEAMRKMPEYGGTGLTPLIRQAVEAFADAVCAESLKDQYLHRQEHTVDDHPTCRAALLKRVMGDA